jgi:hypothetical protein
MVFGPWLALLAHIPLEGQAEDRGTILVEWRDNFVEAGERANAYVTVSVAGRQTFPFGRKRQSSARLR